jgi:hypothetical protein
MFAERGYTAVEVDIEPGFSSGTAAGRMKGMVSGMFANGSFPLGSLSVTNNAPSIQSSLIKSDY